MLLQFYFFGGILQQVWAVKIVLIEAIYVVFPKAFSIRLWQDALPMSCIWVEEGAFYGMGYIASEAGFNKASEVKDYVTRYRSNQYMVQLIEGFVRRYPGKVVR